MKILIVDDSLLVRMQLKKYLLDSFSDIQIETAANGLEALEKHRIFKPNIVILDYILPLLDGMAVLKILTNFDKQVKIVVISTLGRQQYIFNNCLEAGADTVIPKPITQEIIVKTVQAIKK